VRGNPARKPVLLAHLADARARAHAELELSGIVVEPTGGVGYRFALADYVGLKCDPFSRSH
jgi:hypothetical protein